jgi:hypothetical protein
MSQEPDKDGAVAREMIETSVAYVRAFYPA